MANILIIHSQNVGKDCIPIYIMKGTDESEYCNMPDGDVWIVSIIKQKLRCIEVIKYILLLAADRVANADPNKWITWENIMFPLCMSVVYW